MIPARPFVLHPGCAVLCALLPAGASTAAIVAEDVPHGAVFVPTLLTGPDRDQKCHRSRHRNHLSDTVRFNLAAGSMKPGSGKALVGVTVVVVFLFFLGCDEGVGGQDHAGHAGRVFQG